MILSPNGKSKPNELHDKHYNIINFTKVLCPDSSVHLKNIIFIVILKIG